MQKTASNRVLGVALAGAIAVSATALFAAAGNGAESSLVTAPAQPGADHGQILVAAAPAFQVGVVPSARAPDEPAADAAAPADDDAAAMAPGDKPVSYTSAQATRGEKRFEDHCVECHGDDLRGGLNGGPPLRGLSFEQKFAEGAPASALFLFMSTLMPPNSPGRFSADAYADLMAYVLQRNGFQPGAELPSDVDALDHLIMQK